MYVAIIGGSDATEEVCEIAEAVGRDVARAGAFLLCGGRSGVMEAACRGAKEAGGTTIGFLPNAERGTENDHVDIALPTGMGEMRNMLIVHAADVVIAVEGEFGTLSELAFALRIGKPVVGIDTWQLAKHGEVSDAIRVAQDAAEAVRLALDLA
ncbi:MAG: TIGR00725 family protein [Actinobacteria bacterium]|nr:TIGR00725 family protein [Actinomycetota bacterium]